MNYAHLQSLREDELGLVRSRLRPGQRVLEIGAGAGWQARRLADAGFDVVAIDVHESNYREQQVFPVQTYDGRRIPLPDASVDVVFSSNVLEHIGPVEAFQSEIRRVLKPGGRAIHLMPSAAWRFWTSLLLYPHIAKAVIRRLRRRPDSGPTSTAPVADAATPGPAAGTPGSRRSRGSTLRHALFPAAHGEHGTFLSEQYYFSARRWVSLFRRTGWEIEAVSPNGLFYSGHAVLGPRLGIAARRSLSRWFGSACTVYVLRNPGGPS